MAAYLSNDLGAFPNLLSGYLSDSGCYLNHLLCPYVLTCRRHAVGILAKAYFAHFPFPHHSEKCME